SARLPVETMAEPERLVALLAPEDPDDAVLADRVHGVDGDPGRLAHDEPAASAGEDRDRQLERLLEDRRPADAHLAARPDAKRGLGSGSPRERDPRAAGLLQPASRQTGDALLEEDVEALPTVGLPDGEDRPGLAHDGTPVRQSSARRMARFASGMGSASSSYLETHSQTCPVPGTTSPSGRRARNTWSRTVRSG